MNEIVNYDQMMLVADKLAGSQMCPHKRGEDALFAIMVGRDIGLSEGVALQTIYNVNGKACIAADMKLALVKRHPEYAGCEIESTSDYCIVKMKRCLKAGYEDSVTSRFGKEDADRANLSTKDNYRKYPQRMYKARAISYACNDLFPDAVYGLMTVEEAQDLDPEEILQNRASTLFARCEELLETKALTEDEVTAYSDLIAKAKADNDIYSIEVTYKKLKHKKDKQVIITTAEVSNVQPQEPEPDKEPEDREQKAKQVIEDILNKLISHGKSAVYIRNSLKKHLNIETDEKDWKSILWSAPFDADKYISAYTHWKEEVES